MYDFDRIVKAAESCDFHDAFSSDIKHCENALGMGGLMAINAECWLDVLNAMPDAEIAEYVQARTLEPVQGYVFVYEILTYLPLALYRVGGFLLSKYAYHVK